MLKAVTPHNGIIISKNLRQVLEEFDMGKHAFYDVQITNVEDPRDSRMYYSLHCMTYILDITDFSKSVYRLTDYNTQSIVSEEPGLYKNAGDLVEASRDYFKENKGLMISRRALGSDFDVVFGFTNNLIVSNNVKQRIESSSIKGVQLRPFKEIIPT